MDNKVKVVIGDIELKIPKEMYDDLELVNAKKATVAIFVKTDFDEMKALKSCSDGPGDVKISCNYVHEIEI